MENLKKEIEQLKQEKNAVLLAHYYVDDAVQEECQDLKPRPYSDHARSEGRLPNGSYGRCRED